MCFLFSSSTQSPSISIQYNSKCEWGTPGKKKKKEGTKACIKLGKQAQLHRFVFALVTLSYSALRTASAPMEFHPTTLGIWVRLRHSILLRSCPQPVIWSCPTPVAFNG
jgi:hypothetical protein